MSASLASPVMEVDMNACDPYILDCWSGYIVVHGNRMPADRMLCVPL